MTGPERGVAIVVDPSFGEQIRALPLGMPVWVVDTPANRDIAALAGTIRSITTFVSSPGESPEEACIRILPAVDRHHNSLAQNPAYLSVEVFGAKASAALREVPGEYGLTVIEEHEARFVAQRPGWAPEARGR